jgi:cell division protein FtsN
MLESSRLASRIQDDGFHEIQLNGKQLVFVFMAATVVSVVIFLCGVLVGRGVRVERMAEAQGAPASIADTPATGLVTGARPPTVSGTDNDPTKAPPPSPPASENETGKSPRATPKSTEGRAQDAKPEGTHLTKTVEPRPADAASKVERPVPKTDTAAVEAPPSKPAPQSASKAPAREAQAPVVPPKEAAPATEDAAQGWMVQVAAVNTRNEADSLVKRLSAKGYPAFVSNSANVFRVRLGGYKSKGEAETVAAKLRKEEKISPWVTR